VEVEDFLDLEDRGSPRSRLLGGAAEKGLSGIARFDDDLVSKEGVSRFPLLI